MKNILNVAVVCFFFCGVGAFAQQNFQFTQYMYNTAVLNPAYTGSRDVLSVTGLHRSQWIGLEGAPKTLTFAVNGPVSDRVGLGISIVNNKMGPSDDTVISADLSYNIRLNYDYRLFFGLKGTSRIWSIDDSKLNKYDPNDPNFISGVQNEFSPNFGAGIYLQSENTYIGISVPSLLETKQYMSDRKTILNEKMAYYFMAGHVFDLSYNLRFKPAVLVDLVEGNPLQVNVSANFLIYEKLTLGAAYRWDAALSGLVGFQITPGLFAGYAYDADTTRLGNYNSGSHEVFLRFELSKKINKVLSPRFF